MLAAGVDIAVVSKRLGHSQISLTSDTYGHLIGRAGSRAPDLAEALVPRRVITSGLTSSQPHPATAAGLEKGQVRKGAPSGTRTPNPLIKSQLLCQLS